MGKEQVRAMVGTLPKGDSGYTKRIRFHQGWWRAFVLNEPEGKNPSDKEERVCNTILLGEDSNRNFLTQAAVKAIERTKEEREIYGAGIFSEGRLFNNLLSSQPLAFNFFGELQQDLNLATRIFSRLVPLDRVTRVMFEFAPSEKYSGDNSAFDVALEIERQGQSGLIGIECKYTDTFSPKVYDTEKYKSLFKGSTNFTAPYETYTASRFNQLFRNQLIAEGLIQNQRYAFAHTCLFCYPDDTTARETGKQFKQMIRGGDQSFSIITYDRFISAAQQVDLTWQQREWTMLLWARYCGLRLSALAYGEGRTEGSGA